MGVQNILPLVVLSNETKNFKIHKELTELLTETLVPTRTRTTTTSDTYRVLPQWRVALKIFEKIVESQKNLGISTIKNDKKG